MWSQGKFTELKFHSFVLDSHEFSLRIHTEFNNLLNVNESADVRQEVETIFCQLQVCSFSSYTTCIFETR